MLQTEYRPKEQELLEHARDTTWSDIHAMQRGWICTRNNMVWRARNRVCTRSNAPFNVELKRNSSNLLFSKTCFTHSYWPFFATWRHTRDKVTLYKVIPLNVGLSWGLSWGLSRVSVSRCLNSHALSWYCWCVACRAELAGAWRSTGPIVTSSSGPATFIPHLRATDCRGEMPHRCRQQCNKRWGLNATAVVVFALAWLCCAYHQSSIICRQSAAAFLVVSVAFVVIHVVPCCPETWLHGTQQTKSSLITKITLCACVCLTRRWRK